MAFLAIRRIAECLMVRRSGSLICSQMATVALGGKSLAIKFPHGAGAVARVTICYSMSPDQRKTILVRIDVLERNLPTADFMA